MFLKSLSVVIVGCGLVLSFNPQNAQAGGLIIHDGGSLTVKSGSTLFMNCNTTTIESGGTFTLDGGIIDRFGKLVVESGGRYIIASPGTIDECKETFFIIPGPNGKIAVIYL